MPKALRRPPSPIQPDVDGSNPMNYYRLVKNPVFDRKCAPCHREKQKGPHFDYWDKPFDKPGPLAKYVDSSRASRSDPLKLGAHASALVRHLTPAHHGVTLTKEEFRRVVLWLDLNSVERTDFDPTPESYKRVVAGEAVVPVHPAGEYDPNNPTGVQLDGVEPWVKHRHAAQASGN
jgi:hypothetical protein